MASGNYTFEVFYPLSTTGPDSSVTVTQSTTWITSPTASETVNITAPLRISLGEVTESATYSLLQEWIGPNISWTVGQGGLQGEIPLLMTTTAVGTSSDESTSTSQASSIASVSASTTSSDRSDGGSTSSGTTSSSTGGPVVPTAIESSQPQQDGLSSGAAAGIGIGSAAGGALLALLAALFFMRRKSRVSNGYGAPGDGQSTPSDDSPSASAKSPAILMAPLPRNRDGSSFPLLPPATENSELVRMFSTLSTMIQNHAYSFFSHGSVGAGAISSQEAIEHVLGPGAPVDPKELVDLLNGPQRVIAVRFLLGWAIVSNIDPSASPNSTLLPPEFADSLRTLGSNANAEPTLLSKWRHLTGTLLAPAYGTKPTDVQILNRTNLTKVVDLLDEILAPLASSGEGLNRRSNLEQMVKLGAQSGYILLTQPTGWKFDWQGTQTRAAKAIVVFPDLVQVEDDGGMRLDPPRHCNIKQVVNVG